MAVTQISKVKVRRGTKDQLSQLEGGEFGWCIDTEELFIGVGTDLEAANPGKLVKVITDSDVSITGLPGNVSIAYNTPEKYITDTIGANQTSNVTISGTPVTFTLTEPATIINYVLKRNIDYKVGQLYIAHNGTTVKVLDNSAETVDIGVVLSATMVGTSAVLTATTTSGTDTQMKFTKTSFTW